MALIGNGNVARKIKGQYIGVNNIARKVTKGYIGVNNKAQLWFSSNVPLELSYTGTMTYEDDGEYRYFTITNSGVLSLTRPANLEYWICGGGGKGYKGVYSSKTSRNTGGGGGGGFFKTGKNTTDAEFTVTIGAAAANSSIVSAGGTITAPTGETASSRTGADGGSGGGSGINYSSSMGIAGSGCGESTIPFADSHFTKRPCAGGAGGVISVSKCGGAGGSNGSDGSSINDGIAAAAETGGGYPLNNEIQQYKAQPGSYYGAGGAGGSCYSSNVNYIAPSDGYQGVCFIRIPLSEFAA